ncbi:hypothetical protein ABW19_dt0202950 [Dactylella cylindrospora]|nr:hypothetical protein ABW19_dt0202950 [Dactylella cylindrospora]
MGLPKLRDNVSFENQSVLVTGSNTGIGIEFARIFLRRKAKTVFIVVRNLERGKAAILKLRGDPIVREQNPKPDIRLYQCDQSSLESVTSFAKKFKEEVNSLNIAVLNAGINFFEFVPSVDGWETNFHVNCFSGALLALELIPLLKKGNKSGAKSHLFFTSSLGHGLARINPTEILSETNIVEFFANRKNPSIDPSQLYSTSKLCLQMFVEELAKHEKSIIITSGCPGVVLTDLYRNQPVWVRWPVVALAKLAGRNPLKATEALTQAILTETTGTYWANGVMTKSVASTLYLS